MGVTLMEILGSPIIVMSVVLTLKVRSIKVDIACKIVRTKEDQG
jgi:hypothetical protein